MKKYIEISNMQTWPKDILQFLEENYIDFIGWECKGNIESKNYDYLVERFISILKNYSLKGFHSTKLIKEEIQYIKNNGLLLQDLYTCSKRIDYLVKKKYLDIDIAAKLKEKNQCNEFNRKHMIWFCFFNPKLAGESGIRRFYKSWGGEALYNSHEGNSITGQKLSEIGYPIIIEAIVPLNMMKDIRLPYGEFVRVYLEYKGYILDNPYNYESYIIQDLPPEYIVDIHKYPSTKFIEYTDCNNWCDKLF